MGGEGVPLFGEGSQGVISFRGGGSFKGRGGTLFGEGSQGVISFGGSLCGGGPLNLGGEGPSGGPEGQSEGQALPQSPPFPPAALEGPHPQPQCQRPQPHPQRRAADVCNDNGGGGDLWGYLGG